jgi:glucosamine-6-phosphate deaminase
VKWEIVDSYEAMSRAAALILLRAIRERPDIVLGLPTGRTPEGMYEDVVTFNLDEYVGLSGFHPGSYYSYMKKHLFDHIDIDDENVNLPDGTASQAFHRHPGISRDEALAMECSRYEGAIASAGSLQLTFLGLGRNGHIAFNEPGTPFDSRTRVVSLSESTRRANAAHFPGGATPDKAITMGLATITESRAIVLLASGESKREAVKKLRSGEVTPDFPASILNNHTNVQVIVDRAAAGE